MTHEESALSKIALTQEEQALEAEIAAAREAVLVAASPAERAVAFQAWQQAKWRRTPRVFGAIARHWATL